MAGESEGAPRGDAGWRRLTDALRRRVDGGEIAGVVAFLSRGPGHARVFEHGHADIARGLAMTSRTQVRMYSMSKPITAALTLALCERGYFTLDTPAAELVPALGRMRAFDRTERSCALTRPITIRHLLTHTAGFVYANPDGTLAERSAAHVLGLSDGEPDLTLAEWTARIVDAPLAHQPGEAFRYGVSMDILARIAEVACAQTFDRVLRTYLFDPLEMHDTGFQGNVAGLAPVYGRNRVDAAFTPLWGTHEHAGNTRFFSGGGGVVSTAADYLRFCEMLLGEGARAGVRVLDSRSVEELRACHVPERGLVHAGPECGEGCGYGLGVRVVSAESEFGARSAYGWDGLAGTTFLVDPTRRFSALLITQTVPWPDGLHAEFRRLAYAVCDAL